MYAIIKTGSKQYRVKKGDIIDVELLSLNAGDAIEFDNVLFISGDEPFVGGPTVNHFIVKGEVIGESAGPKITSIKYRPSHNERKKLGHKQRYSRVKITEIQKVK